MQEALLISTKSYFGQVCDGIYLVRNEKHFKLYNFSDGKAFEPDFVLFLLDIEAKFLTCQVFIEPKGKYLKEHDKWKEEFLKQITEMFGEKILHFETQGGTKNNKLVGIPFYNNEDENLFRENLHEELEKVRES